MQHDPVRVADTLAWLARAKRDLGVGRHDLKATPPYTGEAMFHAQQTVEKALKGFLTWHEVPFRKTHDLRELFDASTRIQPSLNAVRARAVNLAPFVWLFRYPGETEEPSLHDAREALAIAEEALNAILTVLPREVHP